MADWWKPWTWGAGSLFPGRSHADNFIRNLPNGAVEAFARCGLPLSPESALQLAAVLCAVRVIAEGVAQVPLKVLREEVRGGKTYRVPATDDPIYRVLHRRPNPWMTSFEWREMMTIHAVLWGNAYSVINRVDGKVDELIPIVDPDAVTVDFGTGVPVYWVAINGRTIEYAHGDIFHLRGPSIDGRIGLPVIRLARGVLSLALGLEYSQEKLQRTGGRPSGILSNQGTGLSPEAKKDLSGEWSRKFGPGGEGGIAVLDGGWTFAAMMMSAVDAQHIENRRFQIEEVGRVLRVLPIMIMHADKTSTFASTEQFFIAHVVHTLDPWIKRWEHALDRDLIEDENAYAHFLLQGLMRGAAKDRAEYYTKALGSGGAPAWLTQNEIRAMEDIDPIDGGDELFAGSQNAKGGTPPEDPSEPPV